MVDARDSVKEVKLEEKGSMCKDELMFVASDSANVVGGSMDGVKLIGVRRSEVANDLEDDVGIGWGTVEMESIGERKWTVAGDLTSEKESVGKGDAVMVASKSLEVMEVVDISGLAVATRLVAEIVEVVYRDGEPRMDGLSMQEETTSEIKKSKDIAVPTYR